ncbi:MAG: hypothetical protein HC874_14285 [Richelia sp. SL_2_1]|nr:hypothetical protein [Richelia sp. SL_2_1]
MIGFSDDIKRLIVERAKAAVVLIWERQGHKLTGKFSSDSIEEKIIETASGISFEFYVDRYVKIIDDGVVPSRVAYTPGSKRGGKSKYIEGLTDYASKRFGVSRKEAESIAFAIASKAIREGEGGIPNRDSKRYSKTGERTGFIQRGLDSIQDELSELILSGVEQSIIFTLVQFNNNINVLL